MINKNRIIKECINQNKLLVKKNLSVHTFSNVSVKLDKKYFVIKPSGIFPKDINNKKCPVIKISDGKKIYGEYKPSTDTLTHQILYKKYPNLKSIAHTHSKYATAWAQSGKSIPIYGTTHSDYWKTEIPVTKYISYKKLVQNYERNTGHLIVETLQRKKLNSEICPGVIVAGHGTFTWANTEKGAVIHSELLEFIAEIAYYTEQLKVKNKIPKYISKKHFDRKYGSKAYYGQK